VRNWVLEKENRIKFLQDLLQESGAKGFVFGNSGGKDAALVGILCKFATKNVFSVCLPCGTKQNFTSDIDHARLLCEKFGIENVIIDLTSVKEEFLKQIGGLSKNADANVAPRLRMTTLYALAAEKNYLVAGTGNRSERYVGYFTKHGDGACDFNVVSDLTVSEVYEFLRFLNCPAEIINKPPSAGLFEGQTDEGELGFSYAELDEYLLIGKGSEEFAEKAEKLHITSEHKRRLPKTF